MARVTVAELQGIIAGLQSQVTDLKSQLSASETKLQQLAMHRTTPQTKSGKRCPICYKFNCTVDHMAGSCPICHAPNGKPHSTSCTK